ncbi:MAG: S-layer homology domain-containing protein [Oscillospiraceae bacterium]|nr:S-layer homology domain-containing protein [Oscillospiraceae bacterium]
MKRKLMALGLAFCMLISLIPAVPVALAAGSNEFWIHYDTNFGCVFWAKGSYMPTDTVDDFWLDGEPVSVNSTTQIHIWFDSTRAIDRGRWENDQELVFVEPGEAEDRNLYVRVRYEIENGWYDELVVDKGAVIQDGYALENDVLTFKVVDAKGSVDVDVFWTDSEYDYMSFGPEEGEVMLDYCWNGGEPPALAEEADVIRDLIQPERSRRKVILADDAQSLTLSWNGYLRHIWGDNVLHDGQWGDLFDIAENSFTLYLDIPDMNCYSLGFEFDRDWNYLFGVNYDMGGGLVFQTVGDSVPTASADDFLPRQGDGRENWPDNVSFQGETGPETIRLLIDTNKAVDWDAWNQEEPELRFVEPWQSDDRTIIVVARHNDFDGWHEDLLVDMGQPAEGVSFENNVLTFTPTGGFGVDFDIFWTRDDYEFAQFDRTEDRPVMVEASWSGGGAVTLVDQIPEEDVIIRGDRMRIRLPDNTQSLTFTWDENSDLRQINVEGLGENGDWLNGIHPEGNSYTLQLDQIWDNGDPRDWYNIQFEFEWDSMGRDGKLRVEYDENRGSVFQALGEELPEFDPEDYMFRGGDGELCFLLEGQPQTVRLLLDEAHALDWDAWDQQGEIRFRDADEVSERSLNVGVRTNGWEGYVLLDGSLTDLGTEKGFAFADQILSFTPANNSDFEINIWWTEADMIFDSFHGTEEAPVVVQLDWWGDGTVHLPEDVSEENRIVQENRARIRVPFETESVTFTWDESDELRQINVEGLGENGDWLNGIRPEGNTYTLQLDQTWDNGEPRDWYSIQFEFEGGGEARGVAFYDQGKGSIFWALGEDTPVADPAHYLGFGFENSFCFKQDGQFQPIHLLFDGSKALDFEAFDNGENHPIQFVDSPVPEEKRIVGVFAVSSWCMGPIFWDGDVTENGAAQGVSYEDGILTLQPNSSDDLILHVYWTQADADFDGFQGTDEYPVIVEYRWRNRGEIPVPDGVEEGNFMAHEDGGMARIRLPLDTEDITFTWAEEFGVREIGYSVRSTNGEWWEYQQVDQTQPHSFTLALNQTEMMDDREVPVTWYEVEFDFFEDSRCQLWINWRGSEGNVYFDLNEAPPPVENSADYDLERYYVNYENGSPSFAMDDGEGNLSFGTVYLRLDPAHSVSYFADRPTMYDLPEWEGYSPSIYMEFPLEGALGEWFEGPVVVDGQAVSDFVTFEDDVLSFTPVSDQPIIIHIFWSHEDEAFWNFDTTADKSVMVELMLGGRVPVELPAEISAEDVHIWHAAEHDYVKVRVPAERESLELTWAREGIVSLIQVYGAGENGEALWIDFPRGSSFELLLNQMEDGWPREYYSADFWGFDWAENPFADVSENAWYREAVLFAVSTGITVGTSENSFSPDRVLSRAEFVTFLWRQNGSPEPESVVCPFEDVAANAWYRKAVLWASENGVTSGISPTAFGPNEPCTRAQVVTLLWRNCGSPEPESTEHPFIDVSANAWYAKAVRWAVDQGVTAGTSESTFSPAGPCTRAMAVMFLFRHTLNQWRDEG